MIAPRRPRLSLAVTSAGLQAFRIDEPWTWLLTVPLETDAVAVRVGFANHTPHPYRIDAVAACPSTTYADYANPTGGGTWTFLTFAHDGADIDLPVAGAPARALTVPGNDGDGVPRWAWSDFVPLATLPRADIADGPRVLMCRVLTPPQTTVVAGMADGWQGVAAANMGRDIAILAHAGDAVTGAGPPIPTGPSNFTPSACVQYLSSRAGVTVASGGDSHFAGDSTAGHVANFVTRACFALSTPARPVTPWNAAWGGQSSDIFFPCLLDAIRYAQPCVVVIQGWTFNDSPADGAAAARYLAKVLTAAQRVLVQGGVPILTTPFPRDGSLSGESLAVWQAVRADLLGAGLPVLDATAILADPERPGCFRRDFTTDGVHPNDSGHAALAKGLILILRYRID
jgi:hypothetical protein